jgi:two-component system KDP operon response regulator KdpE
MKKKILVIDDDPGLSQLLRISLEREGFQVLTAGGGQEGLRMAYEHQPDLIILDIMMPEMDGWATCRRLRSVSDTPILILSAREDQEAVVRGLSLGADDYVIKPCSFEELKARIHALLRRSQRQNAKAWKMVYDDGYLYIDLADGSVRKEGELISLTPTESRLLLYLVGQEGRVVPRRELLQQIWGPAYERAEGYLSVYIRYLRRKIEPDPSNPRYIRTHWRRGYSFEGKSNVRLDRSESHE